MGFEAMSRFEGHVGWIEGNGDSAEHAVGDQDERTDEGASALEFDNVAWLLPQAAEWYARRKR